MFNAVSASIETLVQRGWCFRDSEELKGLIQIHVATTGEIGSAESMESELLVNMDLRSIGGKSLPGDPSSITKLSHIQGPKVLQIVSVRDISQSTIEASSGSSHNRRLLRLGLTDGNSEIIAIEYSPIPSIADDIIPGAKVRLENKVAIRNGILCLNPKVVTVLGGVVQSLHEEWQMSKKYSGFARSSLRLTQKNDGDGPPPFEKLQIDAHSHQFAQQRSSPYFPQSTSKASGSTIVNLSRISNLREMEWKKSLNLKADEIDDDMQTASLTGQNEEKPSSSESRPKEDFPQSTSKASESIIVNSSRISDSREMEKKKSFNLKADEIDGDMKTASLTEQNEEKPSSESRPKEVSEAIPVQNQAAAQKLLQKMNQPTRGDRHSRGPKHRGKGREERAVFTLDEWERRKVGVKPLIRDDLHDISHDEEIALRLQNQLDLEDFHVRTGHESVAEKIQMSMFNYERVEEGRNGGRSGFRGRGRGGGRGRGRGRGRLG